MAGHRSARDGAVAESAHSRGRRFKRKFRTGRRNLGVDPETTEVVVLFHPRRDEWSQHFRYKGPYVEGITPVGRATVRLLMLNDARRLELRAELIARGEL